MKNLLKLPENVINWFADLDIRIKIIGLAVGSVLVLGAAATLYSYSVTSKILANDVLHESREACEELSEELTEIKTPLLTDDPATVQRMLELASTHDPMVRYAFITDINGDILFHTFEGEFPPGLVAANNLTPELDHKLVIRRTSSGRIWDVAYPFSTGQLTYVLRTGYSEAAAKQKLATVLAEQIEFTAGMAVISLIVAYLLGSFLARQIKVLSQAACAVAEGDVGHQVKVFSRDALGRLAKAFNEMSVSLANTKKELDKRETLRRLLLVKIIKSQEEERLRVARDLHDNLGQTMSSLGYRLESVSHILETDPAKAKSVIDSIREDNIHAQNELRTTIYGLRPSVLDDLGLIPALRSYAKTRLSPSGIDVAFNTSGKSQRLPLEIETALFRISQEALNNVVRHAKAQNVHVAAAFKPEAIDIDISDDGKGFDETVLQRKPGEQVGILGMRERAELLGGNLVIASQPGKGCRITVHIPFGKEKR